MIQLKIDLYSVVLLLFAAIIFLYTIKNAYIRFVLVLDNLME